MACNDSSNCTDSCDQIDGLFEAASNLVQYRDIIEKWLHGKQNETVQIGGEVVKTLLGLIADIKQLVGVFPDGRTIILDDKRKVLSVLLASGGGIKVKAKGGLYVDVNEILVLGGGLAKDEDGKIYVDFSQMPTDKFESLMKQIRVPIWLSKNKSFYVNGTTGSDTLDEGRGESVGKPFRTIQKAIDFITENYNLSLYRVYINIYPMEYDERVTLRQYQTSGGYITLQSLTSEKVSILGGVVLPYQGTYALKSFSFNTKDKYKSETNILTHITISNSAATLNFSNCDFMPMESDAFKNALWVQSGAVGIFEDCTWSGEYTSLWLVQKQSSNLNLQRDTTFLEVVANTILACAYGSLFMRGGTPGSYSVIKGSATGKRYDGRSNAIINTSSGGPDFFPGTIEGTVTSGAQYV